VDHVAVLHRRGDPRLAQELVDHRLRIARAPYEQELDRDLALERLVLCAEDRAHRALPDLGLE